MSISHIFTNLTVNDNAYSFTHLQPQRHVLRGHGRDKADIAIRLSFQSHVFSRTPDEDELPNFNDENNKARIFCLERYNHSLNLPQMCSDMITRNFLTWESKDRNSTSNLTVIDGNLVTGDNYAIYYYLFPSRLDNCDVELVVKSAYMRYIDFSHIKRRFKTIQPIKTCYFKDKIVP